MKRLLPLLLLLVGLAAVARPVQAHAVPVAAVPAANSVVAEPPDFLEIQFNEPVVPAFSQIQLFNQDGRPVETGPVRSAAPDDSALAVSLPTLPLGTYLVSWQALSAVDGHTTSGSYPLGVGVAELGLTASAPAVAAQLTPLSTAARWLNLTGVALLLGVLAFRLLVWGPAYRGESQSPEEAALDGRLVVDQVRLVWLGLALIAIGAALTLLFQAGQFDLFAAGKLRPWLATPFGLMWLLRLALLPLTAVILWRVEQPWRWPALALPALGFAAAASFTSHSAALAEQTAAATAVDLLHVLAAGVWVGGLVMLGVALWRARRLPPTDRAWLSLSLNVNFSALAAAAVGVLLLTGGYLSWRHVGSWSALFGTLYGLALLAKVGLALLAMGIAAVNLLWVRPRLDAAYDRPDEPATAVLQRRFGRLVRLEALVALLVLAGAGLVSDLQRGADAPRLADQPGRAEMTQPAGDLSVTLALEPALVGPNEFDIYVADENGRPVTDAGEVSLRFTFLGRSVGAAEATAENVGGGHYRLEGGYLSLIGGWQVEVAVRRPGAFDAFAPFRLEAGLGGRLRPAGAGGDPLGRLARFMTQTNGLVSGLTLVLFTFLWGFLAVRAARRDWQLVPLLLVAIVAFWVGGFQLYNFYRDFTPAMFTTNPVLPDANSIAAGQALYEANCATCHGPTGGGDGPTAVSLPSPPANFGAGHTETHSDGDLYYWIRQGIPETAMPAFEGQLTEEETWHLVNYVRRLSAEGG